MPKKLISPDGKNLVFWVCDAHKSPYPSNMCTAECWDNPKTAVHLFYEEILDEDGKRKQR